MNEDKTGQLEAAVAAYKQTAEEMAATQDHLATPDLYVQFTDEDRKMYRHAARMLRELVRRAEAKAQ